MYKNAIIYNGGVFVRERPEKVFVHNRWTNTFTPRHISDIVKQERPVEVWNTSVLMRSFHNNMGHMLLDCYYPAWHSVLVHRGPVSAFDDDINMITFENGAWPSDIIRTISGSSPSVLRDIRGPVRVRHLVIGTGGKGLSIIGRDGVLLGEPSPTTEAIELFRNRIYKRYGIPSALAENVVSVLNKRTLHKVIEQTHTTVSWANATFSEQLRILSTTAVLVVGVGTARTNSFLLPTGSVEVQTFQPSLRHDRYLRRFDDHIATLMDHVRVICPSSYTHDEARSLQVNFTSLVGEALALQKKMHTSHFRSENSACYKNRLNYLARDGWPPLPSACMTSCPKTRFPPSVRNSND